jgi:hypothetical protein
MRRSDIMTENSSLFAPFSIQKITVKCYYHFIEAWIGALNVDVGKSAALN